MSCDHCVLVKRMIEGGVQHCLKRMANSEASPLSFESTCQDSVCALQGVVLLQRVWPTLEAIEEPRGKCRNSPCCEAVKSTGGLSLLVPLV